MEFESEQLVKNNGFQRNVNINIDKDKNIDEIPPTLLLNLPKEEFKDCADNQKIYKFKAISEIYFDVSDAYLII